MVVNTVVRTRESLDRAMEIPYEEVDKGTEITILWGTSRAMIDWEEALVEGARSETVARTCPVCHGRMKVPNGFYGYSGTDGSEHPCQSCTRGIVWSRDPPE